MISVEGTAVVFIVVVVVDGIVVILQVVVHFQGQAAGQFQAVGSSRGGAILRFHLNRRRRHGSGRRFV